MSSSYKIIGMMSGTSLDGLDLVEVLFTQNNTPQSDWSYEVSFAESIPYDCFWRNSLAEAHTLSGLELSFLDVNYGHFIGVQIKNFIQKYNLRPDAIAMHGHTVFHRPEKGLTLQIGSGAEVAAICNLPVISKFRDKDVALNGQGAPLVPIGDNLLFGSYTYCLNLGGIANISYQDKSSNNRIAFDITTCNMALNHLASLLNLQYDEDGKISSTGKIIAPLLSRLNDLSFYTQKGPKSLGQEWYENNQVQIHTEYIDKGCEIKDILRTYVDHISFQIGSCCQHEGSMLLTGGGAKNKFLVSQIQKYCQQVKINVNDASLIEYKEAIIFAFLGLLRLEHNINCLSSVTGASADNIGGCVFV